MARDGDLDRMAITSRPTPDGGVLITLLGELDQATAPQLRLAVALALAASPAPAAIVIDLSGLTAVDMVGVGTLVAGSIACGALGVHITLHHPTAFIH